MCDVFPSPPDRLCIHVVIVHISRGFTEGLPGLPRTGDTQLCVSVLIKGALQCLINLI